MTPDPTLTDEELAEMEKWACDHTYGNSQAARRYPRDVPRLIAALRASRQREAEWREGAQRIATERDALRAEVERLRASLDFYADPANWQATCIAASGPDGPNPGASEWESGPAIDGGYRARVALNVPVQA